MESKLHLIYITGLGDSQVEGQRRAVKTWRWWGVAAELFVVGWADQEPWPPKFERLLTCIDELVAAGHTVGLVGISAGASAAINAFAARRDDLVGVVLIAGKVNRPEAVDPRHNTANPAFVTSVIDCQSALASLTAADRQRLQSRYSLLDQFVRPADSHIPGADNRLVPGIGHFMTIALQITFGAPVFIRFLQRQARKIK